MEGVSGSSSLYTPSIWTQSHLSHPFDVDLPHRPPVYIRRTDISASLHAYERLLETSKTFTSCMSAMSKASADMAAALEDCSSLKGAHACGAAFQAACGLHYLKSNYDQVLCDTFWKEFSIPLLSHLDVYRQTVQDRQLAHEKTMSEQSQILKGIELKYQKQDRQRHRDLSSFRTMLSELQRKVNDMEEIKAQHYTEVLENEEYTWNLIAQKVMLLVRAQVDMADRLSSKAVNDPILESIMATIPDPFQSYGPPKRENELFSILQPMISKRSASSPSPTSPNLPSTSDASLSKADMSVSPTNLLTERASRHSQSLFPVDAASESAEADTTLRADPDRSMPGTGQVDKDSASFSPHADRKLPARLLQSRPSFHMLFGYTHPEEPSPPSPQTQSPHNHNHDVSS